MMMRVINLSKKSDQANSGHCKKTTHQLRRMPFSLQQLSSVFFQSFLFATQAVDFEHHISVVGIDIAMKVNLLASYTVDGSITDFTLHSISLRVREWNRVISHG